MNQQSKQWKHLGSLIFNEAKTVMSVGKVMASIFWDAQGVLLVDYLDKGHTITEAFWDSYKKIRRGKLTRGVLFQQYNAPTPKYTVARAVIQKCGFQLVKDPPYSPDLAPSDYCLFPKIKEELRCHHFARDDNVMNAVDHFLRDQNGAFYAEGIRLLHDHWTKC